VYGTYFGLPAGWSPFSKRAGEDGRLADKRGCAFESPDGTLFDDKRDPWDRPIDVAGKRLSLLLDIAIEVEGQRRYESRVEWPNMPNGGFAVSSLSTGW
jgi:hypothetical protein